MVTNILNQYFDVLNRKVPAEGIVKNSDNFKFYKKMFYRLYELYFSIIYLLSQNNIIVFFKNIWCILVYLNSGRYSTLVKTNGNKIFYNKKQPKTNILQPLHHED